MNWFHLLLQRISQPQSKLKANPGTFARAAWAGLIILATVVILYKFIADWPQLRAISWRLSLKSILLSFGIYSINLLLTASCWALIIGHLTGARTFWEHVRLFCLTNLAQRLPTPLPYITARAEAYASHGVRREITLTAMTIEIAVILIGAVIVALVTSSFGAYALNIQRRLLLIFLLPLLLLVLLPERFLCTVNLLLSRLGRPKLTTHFRRRQILAWIGLFVIIWVNSGVLYYFLISSIIIIPPERVLFLINISALSGIAGWLGQILFFLPTPAVRQIALIYLMNLDFPMPTAVAFALLFRFIVMLFELIWAGVWLAIPALFKWGVTDS